MNSDGAGPQAPEPHKNHGVYFVPGLRRGLLLLETLADARRPLNVSEIAKRMELSRSAVFRLIYTLRFMGFIEEMPASKSFTLGPRVLNIGYAFLASKDIIEVSRGDLELLRDVTNVSAHLAIRDRTEVLYLSCVQTRSGFLSNLNVGTRLPAYATPMGWLLLSELSPQEMRSLLAETPLETLTELSPRNVAEVIQRIADVAARGYAISRGVVEPGGSTIAAPIFDRQGRIVAAIDISGPDTAFDTSEIEGRYVHEVMAAAERISTRLGHAPRRPAAD
jgi:DNA-binding IclR family transcriptional regulator